MTVYTNPPWYPDKGEEITVIRGSDGDSICAMRRLTGDRPKEEQDANAVLLALAPELARCVADLLAVMKASDVELPTSKICDGADWDRAIDDAEALIDLLAEEGIVFESVLGAEHAS